MTYVPPVNPVDTGIFRDNLIEDVKSLIEVVEGGRNCWTFKAAKVRTRRRRAKRRSSKSDDENENTRQLRE